MEGGQICRYLARSEFRIRAHQGKETLALEVDNDELVNRDWSRSQDIYASLHHYTALMDGIGH